MSRLECIPMDNGEDSVVLLEPRPFRPFKSSEEYLYAMKEDLAEWLQHLYPELNINVDNFFEVLEDGVALCKHANNVRKTAMAYKEKLAQQGKRRRKFSSHWDIPNRDVSYRYEVKAGSFFARDNVHNFIQWCRLLGIYECLLFETDDLVLRKNEKSFILCLLEVARRGAHFGMPAPLLVQFEKEIDREIAKDQHETNGDAVDGELSDDEYTQYGPQEQIVTNDLRSLDEMVRDLVEKCSCPTQFPMIRVSEGKYRIGDTKMLIFVRILRNHVMVRVGGGWDTLSHYLEKHDPCRCRAGHRTPVASKLSVSQNPRGATQMQVTYERSTQSPPTSRRSSGASTTGTIPSRKNSIAGIPGSSTYSTPTTRFSRQRSQSPSTRVSLRQRSQSPSCNNSNFTRTGSGRYGNHFRNQSPSSYQANTSLLSPQHLDSLESYDSGVGFSNGHGSSPYTSTQGVNSQKERSSFSLSFQQENDHSATDLLNNTDCASEASDEGYRTGGAPLKTEDHEERPDSSCTQVSQSSSGESGVSLEADESNQKKEKNSKKSKIPLLGQLRNLKVSFKKDPEPPAVQIPTPRKPVSRSNSISSEHSASPFSRDGVGRHSLRTSRVSDSEKSRPKIHVTPAKNTSTWSGRNKRERPALTPDLFNNSIPGTHHSRSTSTGACRNMPRATSSSPHSRRRYFGTSVTSTPTSPDVTVSALHWKTPTKTYPKSQTSDNLQNPSKMSPLLRDMLTDVEIDNDASILKKMEEIVNQYKARVEGILAAEGKTLNEEWNHPVNDEPDRVCLPHSRLGRRNSLDSSIGDLRTRVYPAKRKDTISHSPSKIPMPVFYRSKETCL